MPVETSNQRAEAVIALDLGGTKLASALFTAEGRPLHKRAVPLAGRDGEAVGQLVVRETNRFLTAAKRRGHSVSGIAISVPGIVRPRTGRVWAPNIPGWDDYPLKKALRDAVPDRSVKVVVENDRAAAILGEAWQGAARGCRNAIFLTVGTGIGAGILVDGRVVQGAHGVAGAIGWLALDRPYQPEYVACGCFESRASGNGIANVAAALVAQKANYHGALRAHGARAKRESRRSEITTRDVLAAFGKGDAIARETIEQAIELWGMASANLVSLFNPEKIIFGGGMFGPAAKFINEIEVEARRWAQPVAITQVKFEAAQLGPDAPLYGAAYCVLKGSLSRRRGGRGDL